MSLPRGTALHIARLGKAGLSDGKWRVVSLALAPFIGHAVVARMDRGGAIELRDPLEGVRSLSWEEFEKAYQGTAVWAE